MTIDEAFDEVVAARAALDQIHSAYQWSSGLRAWPAVDALYVAREKAAEARLEAVEAQLTALAHAAQGASTGAT